MEVLGIRPIFMQSAHAQDAIGICNLCETTFPYASTGTNICLKCLTTQTDITSGITKQAVLTFCGTCKRFFGPPWTRAELGSKELLSFCLRRIKGLAGVKISDASFIWTEPNSHRLRLKLTIQKEVIKNVTVQQTLMIDYVLHNQQCEDCKAEYASDTWEALVQVRQKSDQRKNIFLIEQLIIKYNAHGNVLKIKNTSEGVEFFYKDKADALRLVDFLQSTFIMKVKQSKQLISQDSDNSSNYKSVFCVDLPRICKDDLIILTPRLAQEMGSCSCVLICSRVTTTIQFFDPIGMETIEMNSLQFFQYEDEMILVSAKDNLSEFLVFDSGICNTPLSTNSEFRSSKMKGGLLRIVRKTDYKEFEVRTHLADILKEGNWVFGYDLALLESKGYFDNIAQSDALPEILLVKKSYAEVINKKNRIWRLKRLDKEDHQENVVSAHKIQESTDFEEFLNDLESDPEARLNVNLFRDEKAIRNTNRNKMDDENASETSRKNHKKQIKRKLRVRRKSQRSPTAATGGEDRDNRQNNDDDDMQEEKRDDDSDDNESDAKEKEEEEDDPMVKIEELLADLTLEDQEFEEEENDVIEEFIRRLERVKIEGKE